VWIVIFALGVKFLPYGMRFSYSGLLSIDLKLEESARMCGAGTWRVLRTIVLPLTMPAIAATWIYVFMSAIRDLSTAVLLSGANNAIVSVVILNLWDNGEVPQLAALSILIVAGVTVLGVVFMTLATRHNYEI
jgi:iron(III) transport system permease protein